ncbi:MAG: septum formation initiator family protein [Alistipes sp.]|nr:septum formation initiator family protein [Alistipes sp.]MBR2332060.1 septum formation initiator family protein [Alistipes sp.]MBR2398530.1 septum formation initiator family protein [Alistipes sp.]MBR3912200.1 septum formation initiator family protein [Alistipes sp.]MBR6663018.1 septum formation initiator family protein [Alistipes sp.]
MGLNISKRIWQCVTAVIFIYTAVLTVRNLITTIKMRHRISRLEEQRDHYRARIEEDSTMLERLNYDEFLEQYARERFHMQRSNEHIYIVED